MLRATLRSSSGRSMSDLECVYAVAVVPHLLCTPRSVGYGHVPTTSTVADDFVSRILSVLAEVAQRALRYLLGAVRARH